MIKRIKLFFVKLYDRYVEWKLMRSISSGASNIEKAVRKKEIDELVERTGIIAFLRRKLKIKRMTEHQLSRLANAKSSGKYKVLNNRLIEE